MTSPLQPCHSDCWASFGLILAIKNFVPIGTKKNGQSFAVGNIFLQFLGNRTFQRFWSNIQTP